MENTERYDCIYVCENMQGAGDPGFKDREDEFQWSRLSPAGQKDSHYPRTMYALPAKHDACWE